MQNKRPLSPHLSIYKLIPTMAMSIAHRMTGIILYFGTALVALWLLAASSGVYYFELMQIMLQSWIGKIIFIGFTWALIHHMLGGIRHLIWDTGHLFDKQVSTKLAYATILGSIIFTLIIWGASCMLKGNFNG